MVSYYVLFLDLFIKRHEESHKNSELWKTSKVSIVLELVYKTCVIFRQSTKLLRGKNIIFIKKYTRYYITDTSDYM